MLLQRQQAFQVVSRSKDVNMRQGSTHPTRDWLVVCKPGSGFNQMSLRTRFFTAPSSAARAPGSPLSQPSLRMMNKVSLHRSFLR